MNQPRIPIIDLKRQYARTKAGVDATIARVVDSGYFMGGNEVRSFEAEFAAYCGVAHGIAVGSGTAALHLTLAAMGIGPGDEVVTVSFTLSATLDAIFATGATPVLVDVDPKTFTMDPALVARAITLRTKAILPVHIYGHPADMDAIQSAAGAIPVVSDACEAHGTLYKGGQVASLGKASCYSFYPTKNLNGLGDGGGVVTDDEGLAAQLRMFRHHGWDRRFHSAFSSLNSRMDEIHAAVLRFRLTGLDAANKRRGEIARHYDAALVNTSIKPAPHASWATPSYYLYVLTTPDRDRLRGALTEAAIDSDVYWPEPPHLQPAFASLGYSRGSLPVTERLCDEALAIPMFPELTDAEVERICKVLASNQ